MLQAIALAEVLACYILWALAFAAARKRTVGQQKVVRAPSSRWGMVLQGVGFAFVWVYVRPPGYQKSIWELAGSMILAPLSAALGWAAVNHLGKYWRFEAALSREHELVQSGPYRWIRHPICASMLGFLLAVGLAWSWWPMLAPALVFFLAGTEIRIRAEDRLLAERFGESFQAYRSRVRAYLPFIR